MKALEASGADDGYVDFAIRAEPQPDANQLIVDVRAFSLNRGQVNALRTADAGWCPGWDLAGFVSEPAPDGSGPGLGQRVVGWVPRDAWAERVAVSTDSVAVLPNSIPMEVGAALPVAGITALRVLGFEDDLRDKDVLITGAAGGVGTFAIQIARSRGARVVATARGDDRKEYVRRLGAAEAITNVAESDREYDLALESVGGEVLAAVLSAVKPGGRVVSFGNSSRSETCFNVADFYRRSRASLNAFALTAPSESKEMADEIATLISAVKLGTLSGLKVTTSGWAGINDAIQQVEDRQVIGKFVLQI